MDRLSDRVIEIINELHTERLDYTSEYIPLIDAANRLKAYENTGMTPEEIDELIHKSYGPLHKRLGKWIDAEKDGRLVILPCKVGDTVYAAETAPIIPLYVANVGVLLDGEDGCDWEYMENIGKTVFLPREEAEAALKGGDD